MNSIYLNEIFLGAQWNELLSIESSYLCVNFYYLKEWNLPFIIY